LASQASSVLIETASPDDIFLQSQTGGSPLTGSLMTLSGVMFGLIGLVALSLSSRAEEAPLYWIGIGVFGLCIAAIFFLIHQATADD
jgi:hypothetical protein